MTRSPIDAHRFVEGLRVCTPFPKLSIYRGILFFLYRKKVRKKRPKPSNPPHAPRGFVVGIYSTEISQHDGQVEKALGRANILYFITIHLASVLQFLCPEVDNGRLAVGFIHERFNACAPVESRIKTPRALGNLLRNCGLTLSPDKHRANGRAAVRCLMWDRHVDELLAKTLNAQCLHPAALENKGLVDIGSPVDIGSTGDVVDIGSPVDIEQQSARLDASTDGKELQNLAAMYTPAPSVCVDTTSMSTAEVVAPDYQPLAVTGSSHCAKEGPGRSIVAVREFIELCRMGMVSLHTSGRGDLWFGVPARWEGHGADAFLTGLWWECDELLTQMHLAGEIDDLVTQGCDPLYWVDNSSLEGQSGQRRKKNSASTKQSYRTACQWIRPRLRALQDAGWTRDGLFKVGRFLRPFGDWGLAWSFAWRRASNVELTPDGKVMFSFHELRGEVQQSASPR